MRQRRHLAESDVTAELVAQVRLEPAARERIAARAGALVKALRDEDPPGLMESFLAEYGLNTDEGVALMCLAEAYLRTPDTLTLDALIRDKIGGGDWSRHRGGADSPFVNVSTWALMLTGRVFRRRDGSQQDLGEMMLGVVRRLGEPVARAAVSEAMRLMGRQFVLGRDIDEALEEAREAGAQGYAYSFDMLGEAARTEADAQRYFLAYSQAVTAIARHAQASDTHDNHGISVKLSALHPRYEFVQRRRVRRELVPRLAALAEQAHAANIGLSVDAEEMDRLDLSLDVIEAVLSAPSLADWPGFGVVVQAYSKQAPAVLEWLDALTDSLDRRIAVRLVKGAYWDAEIKAAQVLGLASYPVFTSKAATDVSYLACAERLLDCPNVFPQFATHNAHTASAIVEIAAGRAFEFQRLHGMGEALHQRLRDEHGNRCRVYAPVGVHKDLLAYLVRRLLENGANSSFVHQVLDRGVAVETVVADPLAALASARERPARIALPPDLFGTRRNSRGFNVNDPLDAARLEAWMKPWREARWEAHPLVSGGPAVAAPGEPVYNPADRRDCVGFVREATLEHVTAALQAGADAGPAWDAAGATDRAAILRRAADLYEAHTGELLALASREAGKTRLDGLLEIREAVDFLRYYAGQAEARWGEGARRALGTVVCISPWNFPLAIFTGQVAAALAAGNAVLAKPAEQTPLIAFRAVQLLHEAGVPQAVLSLLPGPGQRIGAALVASSAVDGVCFTGSTDTARAIDRTLAGQGNPGAVLIAETGGLNAMLVDSTALPEQAVRDIVQSAFQSAGQRCSALRLLVVQEEIAETLLGMLAGAVQELEIGDPWDPATDVGPVIDAAARAAIEAHCETLEAEGRQLLMHYPPPATAQGTFVPVAAYRLEAIEDLTREVFGPVLHVTTFHAADLDATVARINAQGYGLTLGMHSRVDERMDRVCSLAQVGNVYLNRNQIGAVVGVQPFGGEGLSGTGPKAGGPLYLYRLSREVDAAAAPGAAAPIAGGLAGDLAAACERGPAALRAPTAVALRRAAAVDRGPCALSGPTGERNHYSLHPRGLTLCTGGGDDPGAALAAQCMLAVMAGNPVALWEDADPAAAAAVADLLHQVGIPVEDARVVSGELPELCRVLRPRLAACDGGPQLVALRRALAGNDGPLAPVLDSRAAPALFHVERVVSEDTTASGGNARLLAQS